MRTGAIISLFAVVLTAPALATAPDQEIRYLLTTVGDSGCTFTRNGKQHTASEAEAHLAMKYDRAGSRIKSAEAFIDRLASESSWTGKPYTIQCGEVPVHSRDWLTERLERYRAVAHEDDA